MKKIGLIITLTILIATIAYFVNSKKPTNNARFENTPISTSNNPNQSLPLNTTTNSSSDELIASRKSLEASIPEKSVIVKPLVDEIEQDLKKVNTETILTTKKNAELEKKLLELERLLEAKIEKIERNESIK